MKFLLERVKWLLRNFGRLLPGKDDGSFGAVSSITRNIVSISRRVCTLFAAKFGKPFSISLSSEGNWSTKLY
jgi:hypothetical protein